jgi:hypothetical protein
MLAVQLLPKIYDLEIKLGPNLRNDNPHACSFTSEENKVALPCGRPR